MAIKNLLMKVLGAEAVSYTHLDVYKRQILSYKGNVFGMEPPNFVKLEVTATEPGVRGDTATNVTKPATLETGAEIKVPLFVNEGDIIQIDTRTGEYMGRE